MPSRNARAGPGNLARTARGAGGRPPDRPRRADRPGLQVDVAPAQREQLAAAHAGARQEVPGDVQVAVVARPGQEVLELGGRPRMHLGRLGLLGGGRLGLVRRVASQWAGIHGLRERGAQDGVDVPHGAARQPLAGPMVLPVTLLGVPVGRGQLRPGQARAVSCRDRMA